MMSLVRLVYTSRLALNCGPNDVLRILGVSRNNNPRQGITGALCYDPRCFLQCLEGDAKSVNELYNTIVRDDRHTDIRLLQYQGIQERRFGEWSMAYVRADDVTKHLVLRFSKGTDFVPDDMVGEQAVEFLAAVCEERRRFLEEERKTIEDLKE